jgi:hypothetical protein
MRQLEIFTDGEDDTNHADLNGVVDAPTGGFY